MMKFSLSLVILFCCTSIVAQSSVQGESGAAAPGSSLERGLAMSVSATGEPRIICEDKVCDFGVVSQNQALKHKFVIKNSGDAELKITQVIPSCACAAALPEKNTLAPGESTEIDVTLRTLAYKGKLHKTITVVSNDPKERQLRLSIECEVLPPFYVKPAELQMGKFSRSEQSKVIPFDFVITKGTKTQVSDVASSHPLVKVERVGEFKQRADGSRAARYQVHILEGAPVGLLRENITLTTDLKVANIATLPLIADVEGEVRLSQANLNFGACRAGESKAKELIVTKIGKAGLRISEVEVKPAKAAKAFSARIEPIEEGRKYKVVVSLREDAKPGYLKGSITVRTNIPGETAVKAWFHAYVKKAKK